MIERAKFPTAWEGSEISVVTEPQRDGRWAVVAAILVPAARKLENRLEVAARMPLLSAYLGHADPAGTYWYLTAVPELMELAAARLDRHVQADVV